MVQLITPADVEQAVIDELAGLVVGTSIPETKPPLFFRVLAVGGAQLNLVQDEPLVTLEAFALRETQARDALAGALARLASAVQTRGEIGSEPTTSLRVVGLPQNYPLPSVPTHRRYMTTIAPAVRRRITTL
ncbi:tail terminator [Microbacterium phage Stoor]|uniref:tail terminator n=1 Tax=Microbacterium phage Stoor TaxID=2829393 RepID=UPI001BEF3DEA|nr:tail terminator [Microbacterium phage Stoor]QUE26051.1 tail terminator [Microbacterium phage Stoor]